MATIEPYQTTACLKACGRRHYGSKGLPKGVEPDDPCKKHGHKSAAMTLDNYGHLFDDDLDGVADRMGVGFRAAAANSAAECGQKVGKRPDLRVVGT